MRSCGYFPLFAGHVRLDTLFKNQEFLNLCATVSQANFRLNGSHLSISEMQKYTRILQKYTSSVKAEVYLDLQGNKLRIGKLKNHLQLIPEKMVKLKPGSYSSIGHIPIPHLLAYEKFCQTTRALLQEAHESVKAQLKEIRDHYRGRDW